MKFIRENFDVSINWMTKLISSLDEKFHTDWLVPDLFAFFWFVEDPVSLWEKALSAEELERWVQSENFKINKSATARLD